MKTKILKKYPLQIIQYIFAMIVALTIPYLFSYLIDKIILANNFSRLLQWFFLVLVLSLLSSLLSFFFIEFATIRASINNSCKLSINAIKKMLRIPVIDYTKKEKSYYLNVITNSAFTYGDIHTQVYLELISSLICVVLIVTLILFVDPILCIVFIIYIPIVVFSTYTQSGKLANMQKDSIVKQDAFLSSLKNIIDHKREINVLKENDYFIEQYSNYMNSWKTFITKYKFLQSLISTFPSMISNIYGIVYLVIGTYLISKGNISTGMLIMGYQYLQIISGPINGVAQIYLRYKANKEHIDRVDLLDLASETNNDYESKKTIDEYIVSAENFNLYLDEDHKNLLFKIDSLRIPTKGLFLFKGKNGVGKSMMLNLLLGLVDIKWTTGEFNINMDISNTGYLTYPLFFINGSFSENIFNRSYSPHLLEVLNIDFCEKLITTNPVNLSLGQQQKIALLRVLSMNTKFIFLDEPNSNLDRETQNNLKSYIQYLKNNKGIIIIMHDDNFDDIADEIYEIKDYMFYRID
ncbi:MAG: ATP-binding cassette domain-containing protein [Firmicutes bacterium]|nr:ATP-binding cassette domain-containing protein [Bacillota bacterium]